MITDDHSLWWHRLVLVEAIRYGAEDRLDMECIEEYVDELIEAVKREAKGKKPSHNCVVQP